MCKSLAHDLCKTTRQRVVLVSAIHEIPREQLSKNRLKHGPSLTHRVMIFHTNT